MSGALPKVGSAAQSAFAKVDAGAAKAERGAKKINATLGQTNTALNRLAKPRNIDIGSARIVRATNDVDRLNRSLKQVEATGKRINLSGGAGMGGMRGGGFGMGLGKVAGLAAMLGLGTAAVGATAFSANAGLQGGAQRMSFQTMAGDAQGAKLYTDLTKFAQESIFGNELYKNAQTQMAFGADAKQVMPSLKMLGDVSMGDKERLGSLNLAYSQVRSAGKLMGQDLLQFVNAGFNPLQEISAATGKSMAQLRKDMSDGKISFDAVDAAFVRATSSGGKFYKMTERIADTPFGKVEAMKGQLQGLGLQIGEALAPAIGKLIDRYASPAIDYLGKEIIPRVSGVVDSFMGVAAEYGPLIKDLVTTGAKLVKPVVDMLGSDEFKSLGANVLKFATGLGEDLIPVMKELTEVMRPIAGTLSGTLGWLNTGFETRKIRNELKADMRYYNTPEGRSDAYGKMEGANRQLNAQGRPGPVSMADIAKMIVAPGATPAALFGNANLSSSALGKATNTKTTADVLSDMGGGGGNSGSNDAITGGGSKVININATSNFNIEKLEIAARAGAIENGSDMERLFNQWFTRLINTANVTAS